MRMRFQLVLILLLFTILPAFAQQNSESSEKSLLLALESGWNQAEIHHDATAAAAILADTFVSVDHHGKLFNKAQYLADMKDLAFKPEEISNSETSVYVYGDVAVITSVYRTHGTDDGKPFTHHGRFTDTWIKRDGKWQCVADQETLIN